MEIIESIPGKRAAHYVQDRIRSHGIQDIELFFDHQIKMWAVCQVTKRSSGFMVLNEEPTNPIIMWWVKTPEGTYREPSEQDISDAVIVVKRGQAIFEKGDNYLADALDAQDKAKDDAHKAKRAEMIKDIAPKLQKHLRREFD